MAIKTSLKQLITLFGQSASNAALPKPIRQFAAQLTVLTAHMQRVEAKTGAAFQHLDKQISDLASIIIEMQQSKGNAGPAADEQQAPSASAQSSVSAGDESDDSDDPESEEEFIAKAQREIDEEMSELNGKAPSEPAIVVTPPRKNGGKKAPNAGGVA